MPQPFNAAVMTNAGAALLTKAQAGQCTIEFTRMAIGNGSYSTAEKETESLQKRTTLKSLKNSYTYSDLRVTSDRSVSVKALLTNQDPVTLKPLITEGYYITEVALFARPKGGGAEVMYAIAVTAGPTGDFMPPYNGFNPAEIIQEFLVTTNNSASVTIVRGGAALLAEDANVIEDDVTRKRYRLGISSGNMYYEEEDE